MSLQLRLIVLVGLALLVSLVCGSALVGWHEAHSVQTEMRAALAVGEQAVRLGVKRSDHPDDLRRLIDTFNGNRHVQAILLSDRDRPLVTSELLAPTTHVPDWFSAMIGGTPNSIRVVVPHASSQGTTIELLANPLNEVGEVWAESRDAVFVLAIFALLTAVLVSVFVTRTLRPLVGLSAAFQRIGTGDFRGRVTERGPPELVRLASGFNAMTQQLAAAEAQNRRLNARLLTLQAEERAELARNLHDEFGPLLFAVDMTTAAIERQADRKSEIRRQAGSIHDAVGRMQHHVRSLLERLRPLQASGLEAAISRLAAFWEVRRPDISFSVSVAIEEETIGDDTKETIYRVIQEGMSNAVRHGAPSHISVAVVHDDGDNVRVEVSDDGVGMSPDGAGERDAAGFGLIGMRERVMAIAGSLVIRHGSNGKGLSLVATLPQRQAQDAFE